MTNKIQCLDCMAIIASKHRRDFQSCICGNVFVDGGSDFFRRGWKNNNWVETRGDEDE